MNTNDPRIRRRRAGAIAAISGGGAASAMAVGHHGATASHAALAMQDVGMAVGVVLIIVAVIACVFVVRGRRR